TRDQEGSLEGQRAALETEGCERVFEDRLSGARADRPGLREAMDYARTDDVLVVARLDRLGRSLPDALRTVQELTERGIGLKALDVELGTSTGAGRLVGKMLLVLADWEGAGVGVRGDGEGALPRERSREGVARARAAGKRPGPRPKLSDEQISAVRAAVAGGETVSAVARSFGVSRQTIYKALDGAGSAA